MAKMNSKFKYMFDAAPSISLIPNDGAAHVASFTGTAYTLDKLEGYWTNGELADVIIAAVINVTAVDHTTGDETYSMALQGSTDGFTTHKDLGVVSAIPGTGQYVILLDVDTAAQVVAGITQIRLAATLAGTTPSITCYAWIGDLQDAD